MKKPLLLMILDGWGYRETKTHNAIASANTPHWDRLWAKYPHCLLEASGTEVGLESTQMGNSEVGHTNMGAGRIVPQDIGRIDAAIKNGEFFNNPVLLQACQQAKQNHGALHILGLLSAGGVHSHERHFAAMIKLAAKEQVQHIYLHAFLDGRDAPPQSAAASLSAMEKILQQTQHGQIASICGRYYAMDRDNRWDRTQKAYELLVSGTANYHAPSATQALADAYQRNETDEFVKPTTILHAKTHQPISITDGDAVIFMNFRADRARQLTRALIQTDLHEFNRSPIPTLSSFVSLTQYDALFTCAHAFAPLKLEDGLAACIARAGLQQLRIAETEKYAHVTFFFNGGIETPFDGEHRHLIASPKVATYDLCPEMSAYALTDTLIDYIKQQKFDVIICNYANADMVGHSGNFDATVKAIEVLDECLGRVVNAMQAVQGEILVTADHGNAELLYDHTTKQKHTAHTCNPVPLLYIGRQAHYKYEKIAINTALFDIAPTMLHLLGLPVPQSMTGKNLFELQTS
jgi:2,3-bisphosphoglycerate-independent phosphoglycerate mutase